MILAILALLSAPQDNPVDRYFEARWKEAAIIPAPPADDCEFLRRASLDIIGRLPRPEEVRAFEKSPDRTKKIDELLESPEAAEFFADSQMRILLNYKFEETAPFKMSFPAFRKYLRETWAKDVPWSDFVMQLLSDHGDYVKKPATNYILVTLDPKEPPHELTSKTLRIFLGLQVQCARCHDHPFEKVSQEDFWGLTAFFNGLKPRARTTFDGYGVKLMTEPDGMMMIPDTKTGVEPRFLDGKKPDPSTPPLQAFAAWVTGHPQFPRAIVNRAWAHFMGRGFVEPVDKFGDKSRPSHPALLDALSADFARNGTRLRPLYKTILSSRAYQAGCAAVKGADPELHASMRLKPQSPVQMLNTLEHTLRLDVFLKEFYKTFSGNKDLPETYRNPEVFRMYLHLFVQGLLAPGGQAPEEIKYAGSVRLALKLMNGNDLQGMVKAEWGRLAEILKARETPGERVEEIFYTLLSRPPATPERERYLAYLKRKGASKAAYEDIYWVLLNSTELFFNH